MMGIKQANIMKTKRKLIESLERLKNGTYTNRKLKSKRIVKVNAYNVEIEAGSSIGTLRNHPEIKEQIENYEPIDTTSTDNKNSIPSERKLSKVLLKNKELKAKLDKAKAELKRIKEENQVINNELNNYLVQEHELVAALMANVDINKCQTIFKKQDSHLTVIQHDFKTR